MSQQFEIQANFEPAGDQPEAIKQLVNGVESGISHLTLLGVTGSGKTFTMANVIQAVQRPTLILAPNKTLAAQLYGEMREFFPRNSVEYFVSYYDYYQPEAYVPSSDTYIAKDASINDHIEQMRLSATKALLERQDAIVVATVSAIYGLGDPRLYLSMVMHLDRGDKVDQRNLLRRLAELQYTRNDIDLYRTTYRVRGDVIDVYPADSDKDAVRIELFEDEIEKGTDMEIARMAHGRINKLHTGEFAALEGTGCMILGTRFLKDAEAVFLRDSVVVAEDDGIAAVRNERFYFVDLDAVPGWVGFFPFDGAAPVEGFGFVGGLEHRDEEFFLGGKAEFDGEMVICGGDGVAGRSVDGRGEKDGKEERKGGREDAGHGRCLAD